MKGQKWNEIYFAEYRHGCYPRGFIKYPTPSFDDLWMLFYNLKIETNKFGTAELINQRYPFQMKDKLKEIFKSNKRIGWNLLRRLDLLEIGINHSPIEYVPYEQVEKDYQEWKSLKDSYERLKNKEK